jgi:hypothetical protein
MRPSLVPVMLLIVWAEAPVRRISEPVKVAGSEVPVVLKSVPFRIDTGPPPLMAMPPLPMVVRPEPVVRVLEPVTVVLPDRLIPEAALMVVVDPAVVEPRVTVWLAAPVPRLTVRA